MRTHRSDFLRSAVTTHCLEVAFPPPPCCRRSTCRRRRGRTASGRRGRCWCCGCRRRGPWRSTSAPRPPPSARSPTPPSPVRCAAAPAVASHGRSQARTWLASRRGARRLGYRVLGLLTASSLEAPLPTAGGAARRRLFQWRRDECGRTARAPAGRAERGACGRRGGCSEHHRRGGVLPSLVRSAAASIVFNS